MKTESVINVNEVKKELMKSKVNAKLSHYVSGNLYYTVELVDGVYQFPMPIIENTSIKDVAPNGLYDVEDGYNKFEGALEEKLVTLKDATKEIEGVEDFEPLKFTKLSSDLGTTSFYNEMRGSELNRWIAKAIEKSEFIKIG